jgi:hypothetical protein
MAFPLKISRIIKQTPTEHQLKTEINHPYRLQSQEIINPAQPLEEGIHLEVACTTGQHFLLSCL